MKTVLHMGIPKTGAPSLQEGLGKVRRRLVQEEFYYPQSPADISPDYHHVLVTLFENPALLKSVHRKRLGSMAMALMLPNACSTMRKHMHRNLDVL